MCEWYIESCDKTECFERARRENPDEAYSGRTGLQLFIWRGKLEPCEHIRALHGPKCEVFDPEERECNCDDISGEWVYY